MLRKDLCRRLFSERALVKEGDTEYDLIITNKLNAIGPLLLG